MAALEPSLVGLCLRHRSLICSATLAASVVLPGRYVSPVLSALPTHFTLLYLIQVYR